MNSATITIVLTETGHAISDGTWHSPLDGYHAQRHLWRWIGGPGWFYSEENRKVWDHLVDAHDVPPMGHVREYLEYERCEECPLLESDAL